ncbi:MAG: phospholipid-binding protein MlaC [Gemmatimonadota bacterium]
MREGKGNWRRMARAVSAGRRRVSVLALGLELGLGPGGLWPPSHLAAAVQSPLEVIRARNVAVERIVRSAGEEPDAQTRERLKDAINGLIDFRELSRRALGRHWEGRSEQERADFVRVFRDLIRNSSVKKLSIYKADRVTYEQGEVRDGRVDVTTLAYKGRKAVEIVYRMHRTDGGWKVYDMVVDGASTARTYRDSFYKEIAATSYAAMYEKLVNKLAEES